MANQMIALGVRPPSTPDLLGPSMRMANIFAQQRAADRQSQVAQQTMDIQRAAEERAAAKGKQEFREAEYKYYREMIPTVMEGGAPAYQKWLAAVRTSSPEMADLFEGAMPVEQFNSDNLLKMAMNVDQAVSKKFSTPIASFQVGDNGALYGAQTGGTEPTVMTRAAEMGNPLLPDEAQPTGTVTVAPGVSTPRAAAAPPVSILPPKAAANLPPIKLGEGPVIWKEALISGQISETNAQRLLNVLPPEKHGAFLDAFQKQGVQIVPDTALQPQSFDVPAGGNDAMFNQARWDNESPAPFQNALYRGEAPNPMNAIANAAQMPSFEQAQYSGTVGKPGSVMAVPKSANVPLPRVGGESTAEETGKLKPRVIYEPQITEGTETAKKTVELRKAMPQARNAVDLAVKQADRDIADVDFILRDPQREMIVGSVEGRLPAVVNVFRGERGQKAQNLQSRLDKIKASSVVQHLTAMRAASPQGSSLFGQVTEYEDRLVGALAGLDQAQDEQAFDKALRLYRETLTDMRNHLPQVFNDTYKAVGGSVQFAPPAKAPRQAPLLRDIDFLRRNMDRPGVVEGFRKHFGDAALQQIVNGGR